jgi:hypothetical protein
VGLQGAAGPIAVIRCGSHTIDLSGSVVGHMAPVNQSSATFEIDLRARKGRQRIPAFEFGPNELLEISVDDGGSEQAGVSIYSTAGTAEHPHGGLALLNEEPLEISTVR